MSALNEQPGGSHYKGKAIQPVQYIHANGIGYCEGNVIKYVSRWREKNGLQDLLKARNYIDLLIELEGLEKAEFGQQNTIDCRSAEQKVESVFGVACMVCGGNHYGLQCPNLRVTAGQVGA